MYTLEYFKPNSKIRILEAFICKVLFTLQVRFKIMLLDICLET